MGTDVRDRVLRAIAMTGYEANPTVQRLAGGRISIVGVVYTYELVFPHDAGDFYYPFLEGIENQAEHIGIDLFLFTVSPASVTSSAEITETARAQPRRSPASMRHPLSHTQNNKTQPAPLRPEIPRPLSNRDPGTPL